MSNTTTAGVKGGIFAKYSTFDGKKYLRMLVTNIGMSADPFGAARSVLPCLQSQRPQAALKRQDRAGAKAGSAHRLQSRQEAGSQGVYVDDPVSVKPEWFAKPHRDGTPRCHRHYLVESGLTKLENTLYWMMWSLTKTHTIVQSKSGLAALTNYSRFRVIAAIRSW